MTQLALLRHGHTAWNRAGRIQGRTDIALDPEAQAHLARLLLPAPWDAAEIVSSPLSRAVETARLVSGKTPRPVPALTEMDWGAWEGHHGADLLTQPGSGYRHIEDWGWHFRPPGGESPNEVLARLRPWFDALDRDTVAVCHIGIMRVLMALASGWDFLGDPPFRVKRDRLFILTRQGGHWRLEDDPVRLGQRVT
jgi:probable phosphoglycerate mutase